MILKTQNKLVLKYLRLIQCSPLYLQKLFIKQIWRIYFKWPLNIVILINLFNKITHCNVGLAHSRTLKTFQTIGTELFKFIILKDEGINSSFSVCLRIVIRYSRSHATSGITSGNTVASGHINVHSVSAHSLKVVTYVDIFKGFTNIYHQYQLNPFVLDPTR